jgi:hypothetical protein
MTGPILLLDFKKSPPGVNVFRIPGLGSGIHALDDGLVHVSKRVPWSWDQAMEIAWMRHRATFDPPGMKVFRDPELGRDCWVFVIQGQPYFPSDGSYPTEADARRFAWSHYKRAVELARQLAPMVPGVTLWPMVLGLDQDNLERLRKWFLWGCPDPAPVDIWENASQINCAMESGTFQPIERTQEPENIRELWSLITLGVRTAKRRLGNETLSDPRILLALERAITAIDKLGSLTEEIGFDDDGPVVAKSRAVALRMREEQG